MLDNLGQAAYEATAYAGTTIGNMASDHLTTLALNSLGGRVLVESLPTSGPVLCGC